MKLVGDSPIRRIGSHPKNWQVPMMVSIDCQTLSSARRRSWNSILRFILHISPVPARAGHEAPNGTTARRSGQSPCYVPTTSTLDTTMLRWTLIFLVIAVIAGLLGFTGVAGTASEIAKILFFVFLVLLIISALISAFKGRPPV